MSNIDNKLKKPLILMVDDHPQNLIVLEAILETVNCDVIKAQSGNEALSKTLEYDFAGILLDVQMPDMDGFEVARLLSNDAKTQHIPIIFITAFEKSFSNMLRGFEQGAFDYLIKPVDPNILRSKVSILCELSLKRESDSIVGALTKKNKFLEKKVTIDFLTNIPNRMAFESELRVRIHSSERYQDKFALLLLDIDNFKTVNDTLGHSVGDRLLAELPNYLKPCIRKEDFLARIGGDEFAILINRIKNYEDVTIVAKNIQRSLEKPFTIQKKEVFITLSIGIACYPIAGNNFEELFKHADIALYNVKYASKNAYLFYTKELNTAIERKVSIENELYCALENNELFLEYQPQFNIIDNTMIGVEALVRWDSPLLGVISPEEFIPILESTTLIHKIGDWIFEQAIKTLSEWSKVYAGITFTISINCSIAQLQDKNIVNKVKRLVNHYQVDVSRIILEITETVLMERINTVRNQLTELNQMGIKIAIDDFGVGYSSLNYLKQLPISELKIDKSFIADIPDNEDNVTVIKGILTLCIVMGFHIIAEGVETKEQLNCLQQLGCQSAQGYFFAPSLNEEQFHQFIAQRDTS